MRDEERDVKRKWGLAIKRQREFLRMTQEAFAGAVGVDQSTASRWESGQTAPSLERQLAIARVLRIDARVLFAYPDAA